MREPPFGKTEKFYVMTAKDLDGGPLYVADYRDSRFLIYVKTGSAIVWKPNTGVMLGKKSSMKMVDGVWFADIEDKTILDKFANVQLDPEDMDWHRC